MLNSKDKIKAVLTLVEEQKSDSHLLAPSASHSVASGRLCRTPYRLMKQTVTIIPSCAAFSYPSSMGSFYLFNWTINIWKIQVLPPIFTAFSTAASSRAILSLYCFHHLLPHPLQLPRGQFLSVVLVLNFHPMFRDNTKGSLILHPYCFPQIPGQHTDPSCWPAHQRGWCQWGRTHWQARKLDLWKDTVLTLGGPRWLQNLFSTRHWSPCYLQGSQTTLFCGWRSWRKLRADIGLHTSSFLGSRALWSFNAFNVRSAPHSDFWWMAWVSHAHAHEENVLGLSA